jgi:hypothetical protein
MKYLRSFVLCILTLTAEWSMDAAPMGTAFTYQGRLTDGEGPAQGQYDFRFTLYDTATGTNRIGSSVMAYEVPVENGLFCVQVDFGPEAFKGAARWLEIGVRVPPPPRELRSYTPLSPRQAVTPAPYALSAAGVSTLETGPLDISVDGVRALRLEKANQLLGMTWTYSVNVIGGYALNSVPADVVGATIAGGGAWDRVGTMEFSYPNSVTGSFGTVGGGIGNTAGNYGTVPGGFRNSATGFNSFAAGRDAHATHNGSYLWNDGVQSAQSTGEKRFEVHARGGANFYLGTNALFSDGMKGFALPAADLPMITRGFDAFGANAPAAKKGLGRWGVFMEPYNLVLGMPASDIGERNVTIGAYQTNGSYAPLLAVRNTDGLVWAGGEVSCTALTIRGGADLAEPFDLSEAEAVPGSVVVIDEQNPGKLKLSSLPYDRKVAGVISGAGGIQAGIRLTQEKVLEEGRNVALTGRVYVQADAAFGEIQPGDLMTTSTTPGHAMKVSDHTRAQGAILGKAMTRLAQGQGLVLILVTLQ